MPATPTLVRIPTSDGLLLDAALARAVLPDDSSGHPPGRAWVFVHGTGSNFTAPGILDGLSGLLSQQGEAVLRLNTRGHDVISRIPTFQGTVNGGAAYESLADAHRDLEGACNWLLDAGYTRLSLLGHSLGAVKSLLTMARFPIPGVDEVVALSPPRLNHELLMHDPEFARSMQRVRDLISEGRGGEFVEMKSPVSLCLPAANAFEKYGIEDRYDYLPEVSKVVQPTLIVMDTKSLESSAAFAGVYETLSVQAKTQFSLTVHKHHDDIRYLGSETTLANLIWQWRIRTNTALDAGI